MKGIWNYGAEQAAPREEANEAPLEVNEGKQTRIRNPLECQKKGLLRKITPASLRAA